MALSGSGSTNFMRHSLVIEWNATQSIPNNTSTVWVGVYLRSNDQYGTLYAPASNAGSVTVNGERRTWTATSDLVPYQKKLLYAGNFTVGHSATGTASLSISTTYNVNVTYSGVYYGNQTATASATLNTIPRHSSLNAVPTFTLPGASSFSIVRQSSSFTHTCEFWVAKVANPTLDNDAHWEKIKTLSNVATSGSFTFTVAEVTKMISYRGTNTSWQGKVKIFTNGLSGLSAQRYMWINNPPTATTTISPTSFPIKVGQVLTVTLSGFNSDTVYSYNPMLFFDGETSSGYEIDFKTIKTSSFTYTLTQADVDAMLAKMPNSKTGKAVAWCKSFYNSVAIGGGTWTSTNYSGTVDSSNATPKINGTPTYKDTDTNAINLTGNNQTILQGKSNIEVTIPASFASGISGATITNVSASIGGVSRSASYSSSAQVLSVGIPTVSSNTNLVVTVTDSRGLTNSYTKVVTVYPYSNPNMAFSLARKNNFQTETDIAVNSTWSPVTVSGVNKNTISKVSYNVKRSDEATYGAEVALPYTTSGSTIVVSSRTINLSNDYAWEFRLNITDKFGTYFNFATVQAGKPIMFLDAKNQIARFGDLQGSGVTGRVPGLVELEPYRVLSSGKTGIQLNFSDISGVNELQFDVGITSNTFRVLGGNLMINDNAVFNHYPGQTSFMNPVYFDKGIAPKELYASSNLNNVTEPGFYYCPTTATATTIANVPADGTQNQVAFSLLVEKHAGVKQTYTCYYAGAPKTYVRNYYGGTWGNWQRGGDNGLLWAKTGAGLGYGTTANITRHGNTVTIYVGRQTRNWSTTGENVALSETIPEGYRPIYESTFHLSRNTGATYVQPVRIHIASAGTMRYTNSQAINAVVTGTLCYTTNDPYP